MSAAGFTFNYPTAIFVVVLISGCIVNLLKRHFIFQLAGIAFCFTYLVYRINSAFDSSIVPSARELFLISQPMLLSIAACLVSMVLGFWIFPPIRKMFRN